MEKFDLFNNNLARNKIKNGVFFFLFSFFFLLFLLH